MPLLLMGGTFPGWNHLWEPAIVAALFVMGQVSTVLALKVGEVSLATPVMGIKIVLVALLTAVILNEWPSAALWTAAILSSVAVALLNISPPQHRGRVNLTIAIAGWAAFSYALFDVLVQKFSPLWGTGRFLPTMLAIVAVLSSLLRPWTSTRPAGPRQPLWPWLAGGALCLAGQALLIVCTISIWGRPRWPTCSIAPGNVERADCLVDRSLVPQFGAETAADDPGVASSGGRADDHRGDRGAAESGAAGQSSAASDGRGCRDPGSSQLTERLRSAAALPTIRRTAADGFGIAIDLTGCCFQIVEIGLAEPAANLVEMEADVVGPVRLHDVQQVGPQIAAGGATEALPPPDFPNRMASLVPFPDQPGNPLAQGGRVPESCLDRGRPIIREQFIQVSGEFDVGK